MANASVLQPVCGRSFSRRRSAPPTAAAQRSKPAAFTIDQARDSSYRDTAVRDRRQR